MIFAKTSVLNPYDRKILSEKNYATVIDFLIDNYPKGFLVPTDIHIGTKKIEVVDYDIGLKDNDFIVLLERPAIPAAVFGGSVLLAWLANTALSFALSYAVNRIFAPEAPTGALDGGSGSVQNNQASSVYNLNNSQNIAKLGGVIPVVYGSVRMYPSMICQPYYRYTDNDEYLYHLLCVGQGRFNIESLMIDTLDMTNNPDVSYKMVNQGNFHNIEAFTGDINYNQLNNTLSTPSQLEMGGFRAESVSVGAKNKRFIVAQELEVEAGSEVTIAKQPLFPEPANAGTYTVVSSFYENGQTVINVSVNLIEEVQTCFVYSPSVSGMYEIKDGVENIEVDYNYPYGLYRTDDIGNFTTYDDTFVVFSHREDGVAIAQTVLYESGASNNAVRKTVKIAKLPLTKFISFSRPFGKITNAGMNNTLYVNRVKELYPQPDMTDIGDITLLWVKIKATNAISGTGQTQVNGFFRRNDKANDIRSVLEDIYTNTTYGGRLPISDLDFIDTGITANGAFDTQSTIWDALKLVSKSQRFTVYPVGQELLLKYDGVNNINSALYNETNIIRNSLKVQYSFKEENASSDSVECSYRSREDWNAEKVIYPTDGLFPASINLFGVTEESQAELMAKYLYKQEQARVKIITFETDIQGLVPQFLDKILISHSAILWGTAGEVYAVNGTEIELSEPALGYDSSATATLLAVGDEPSVNITFRDIDGSISDILPYTIISEYIIDVPDLPDWVKDGTFYTDGEPKEYLVIKILPKGETVSIECVNYDEEVYT